MKRILFLVNGYGLGNSTRIHSIIQHIGQEYEMDIFGYGNSVEYFKQTSQIKNIFQSFPLEYGLKNGKIDLFRTVGKLFPNLLSIYKSWQYLKQILQSKNYSLIIADSNFSTLFLKNRPKIISINNADIIIKSAQKIKKRFYISSFLIETADYIYNKTISDLVISPFFSAHKNTGKIQHIALMVRKEFLNPIEPSSINKHHVLIMPSGARIVSPNLYINHDTDVYEISVIGNQFLTSGKIQKQDRVFNTSALMNQSTIVVVNGGLSSISEALAMKKPMIVVPLRGHLEQKINADWIQKNNLGLSSSWKNLKESINKIIKNYSFFKKHLLDYNYTNGAQQAVELILKEIENETVR